MVVPFSGGILLGVSIFGLLPELAGEIGWLTAVLLFAAGYAALSLVDRYGYPVCPSCSHNHDHGGCSATLHGFAAPLIMATSLHAFIDGWGIVSASAAASPGIRVALPMAVLLHKLPEGLALGSILNASTGSRVRAFTWCLIVESATLAGGGAGLLARPELGAGWMGVPLAIAGGCFVYLGFHAIHGEWQRRGAVSAFVPAITGAAGAAVLQGGARAWFG